VIAYLKARLNERSTWMLVIGSLGAVAALTSPFNWIGFVCLLAAALTPDGPVK
jgi:hypothetical protein